MRSIYLIIGLFTFHGVAYGQSKVLDRVVAYIGSELVLLSEVEEQFALMKEQNPIIDDQYKCGVLENIMIQKLLINQAVLDSVEVLDSEVQLQLDARIERILAMMNNDVTQFENFYNKSIAEVKEQFRQDLKGQLLAERMQAQVTSQVTVTPSEVKTFFNSVPADSLPYFSSEVEIAEIILMPEVNNVEYQRAYDKLVSLKERIEEGEDFAELATIFSDDPGSGRAGGDLGWMKRGSLVPEYEAEAYNLEKGELSSIVESEFGLHLIELLGRRGNSIHTRHILIKPNITQADMDLTEKRLDSIRNIIITDSIPFTVAVSRFSNKKAQSYNNGGRITNPNTGNTFFEIGDLDPDIYFTIDSMEVGEISVPFAFQDQRGEKGYKIIKLLSQTEPHRASLEQDYFKIHKAAIEQKKNVEFYNWVKTKVTRTYVKVNGKMADCPNMSLWIDKDFSKVK